MALRVGNRLDVLVQSSAAALNVSGNDIVGNTYMGLDNQDQGTLDARDNWWGDSSGPCGPDNLNGRGDAVSARVLFVPWTGTLRPDLVGRFTVVALSDAIVNGDTGSVTFEITNQGTLAADGMVEARVYIRSGSASVLLCPVTGRISLDIGQSQSFTARIAVPTELTAGTYTIAGAVDTANGFVELDERNNFAEAGTHTLDWLFGVVGARKNVPLTVKDASGRNVTFALRNGGTGSVKDNSANGHRAFGIAANILAKVRLCQGGQNYSWPNQFANCWLPDPMDLKVRPLE